MSTAPVEIPLPAEYLPTGDHAMVIAWTDGPAAVLCLEDGRVVLAALNEFKVDWRFDVNRQKFVDVSGISVADDPDEDEGDDGDSDQEPPSDGGPGVPGRVPEAD